jgi:hypothetical protein
LFHAPKVRFRGEHVEPIHESSPEDGLHSASVQALTSNNLAAWDVLWFTLTRYAAKRHDEFHAVGYLQCYWSSTRIFCTLAKRAASLRERPAR